MKTRFRISLTLILALSSELCALSQVPQGFNYQAIARDASGNVIVNKPIQVKFGILTDTLNPGLIWEELHSGVTTNSQGMFSVVIGTGGRQDGSAATFGEIDWNAASMFLKVQVFYNSQWKYMGSSKLWSVPYSMVAGDLGGALKKLEVVGEDAQSDEALFEVKRKDGETIFAVYNHGVRINMPVDTLTKARKGGFAIGSFDKSKATSYQDLLVVNSDSIRAYIDAEPGKARKGGFAIGGFDNTKVPGQEYLRVTRDSTRVYVKEGAKGLKGGFAIGGFSTSKGTVTPFTSLNPDNYFIGHRSGAANITGLYNSFLGYETGPGNKDGSNNALFGFQAGFKNVSGSNNLFLGYQSGYSNIAGSYNSFMGYKAGNLNTSGDKNSFMGSYAGLNNTTGSNNSFVGFNTGFSNTTGASNNFFGTGSGYSNTLGSNNVFIGPESGYLNKSGNFNTLIGYRAGYSNTASFNVFLGYESGFSTTSGSTDVFIGYQAGRSNIGGKNNVFIGNQAGFSNTYGESNVMIGHLAGYTGSNSYYNVFIGQQAGQSNTIGGANVFLGYNAGRLNTWGENNVYIGTQSGELNSTGQWNVCIGVATGQHSTASDNVFLGYASGIDNSTGASNVFIGTQAGWSNTTGGNNIFIGSQTGYTNQAGTGNIFIGNDAGWNEAGSNKLYIDNSNTSAPLIYGDFNLNNLTINGDLSVSTGYFRVTNNPGSGATPAYFCYQGATSSTTKATAFAVNDAMWVTGPSFHDGYLDINVLSSPSVYVGGDEALWYNGTSFSWGYGGTYNVFADKVSVNTLASPGSYSLYVAGTVWSTGYLGGSDLRWKKDLEPLKNILAGIMRLNGYKFNWRRDEYPDMNFDEGKNIGLIAQDVEKLFPELVRTDDKGYKAVSYEKLSVLLLEGMKEQQQIIESQSRESQLLRSELQTLREEIEQIRSMLNGSGSKL